MRILSFFILAVLFPLSAAHAAAPPDLTNCTSAYSDDCPAGYTCKGYNDAYGGRCTSNTNPSITVSRKGAPGGESYFVGGNTEERVGGNTPGGFLTNPLEGIDTLDALLATLLNVLVQIGVVVLTVMIVYCGFLFVTAQGNEEKLRSARSALMWTVIGGLIVLGAEVIATAIRDTVQAL